MSKDFLQEAIARLEKDLSRWRWSRWTGLVGGLILVVFGLARPCMARPLEPVDQLMYANQVSASLTVVNAKIAQFVGAFAIVFSLSRWRGDVKTRAILYLLRQQAAGTAGSAPRGPE